ncbi:MAG: hypothetical protein ACE5JF_11555 [Anaerolineales bacterium]
MLTIFSAPKPFEGEIGLIQENAIESWTRLHPEAEVLLLGDDSGISEASARLGVRHLGGLRTNEWGTPLVNSMFEKARQASTFSDLCFVNTDIILFPDLLDAIDAVRVEFERFLIVGQRWDLSVREPIDFTNGWRDGLASKLQSRGSLHPPAGSDYFAFDASQYLQMPPFAVGRAGWDNWMIFEARQLKVPVVDATGSVTAIHQEHDYRHLPGSQPHYRLPESHRNLELAGGPHTIFTLRDATWEFRDSQLRPRGTSWGRAVEAGILARLGPTAAGALTYAVLHPLRTFRRARGAIRWRGSKLRTGESDRL